MKGYVVYSRIGGPNATVKRLMFIHQIDAAGRVVWTSDQERAFIFPKRSDAESAARSIGGIVLWVDEVRDA